MPTNTTKALPKWQAKVRKLAEAVTETTSAHLLAIVELCTAINGDNAKRSFAIVECGVENSDISKGNKVVEAMAMSDEFADAVNGEVSEDSEFEPFTSLNKAYFAAITVVGKDNRGNQETNRKEKKEKTVSITRGQARKALAKTGKKRFTADEVLKALGL